jgi:hypothetical protein
LDARAEDDALHAVRVLLVGGNDLIVALLVVDGFFKLSGGVIACRGLHGAKVDSCLDLPSADRHEMPAMDHVADAVLDGDLLEYCVLLRFVDNESPCLEGLYA